MWTRVSNGQRAMWGLNPGGLKAKMRSSSVVVLWETLFQTENLAFSFHCLFFTLLQPHAKMSEAEVLSVVYKRKIVPPR